MNNKKIFFAVIMTVCMVFSTLGIGMYADSVHTAWVEGIER